MATDRRLSLHFHLHEFPGWEDATEEEVENARELVSLILQPARRAWGTVVVTSWLRESGAHATGAAVDFVPLDAWRDEPGDGSGEDENGVRRVHGWLATYHPSSFGELLYELPGPGESTPHIHATLPGVGGDGEVLTQDGWTAAGAPTFKLGFMDPAILPVLTLGALLLLLLVVLYAGRIPP